MEMGNPKDMHCFEEIELWISTPKDDRLRNTLKSNNDCDCNNDLDFFSTV